MKIFKAFPAYEDYQVYFRNKNPELGYASFAEQITAYENDFFPWITTWRQHMSNDNAEVFETICNDETLQAKWAEENNVAITADWQTEIILHQIKSFTPDVIILYPPEMFRGDFVKKIRSVSKACIIGSYDGIARNNAALFEGYDLVLTCLTTSAEYYKAHGYHSYVLQFGFDPSVLDHLKTTGVPGVPVGFTGQIIDKAGYHSKRMSTLAFTASHFKLDLRTSALAKRYEWKFLSRKQAWNIIYPKKIWGAWKLHQLGISRKPPVYGLDMFQFMKDCKVLLNIHIDSAKDQAANVRLYEATGVGSCLVTDWKKNINELFRPDEEIVVFKTNSELKSKLKFLLSNEHERSKIAAAGQKRTLKDYNYADIFQELKTFLKSLS